MLNHEMTVEFPTRDYADHLADIDWWIEELKQNYARVEPDVTIVHWMTENKDVEQFQRKGRKFSKPKRKGFT